MKKCAKCNQVYNQIDENFTKDKNRKDGYCPYCRNCLKLLRAEHKGKPTKEREKIENERSDIKECSICKTYFPRTKEYYNKSQSQKDGFHSYCKTCQKEYWTNYHKNQQTVINEKRKQRYEKNRETEIIKSQKYQKVHPEKVKEIKQRHSIKRAEQIQERVKNWINNNPIHSRMLKHVNRAENIDITLDGFVELYNKFKIGDNLFYCHYCGAKLSFSQTQIDHVMPLSKGGLNQMDNMVIACQPCNSKKGSKILS